MTGENMVVWFYFSKTLTCCFVWVDGETDGATAGADVARGLLARVGYVDAPPRQP